MFRQMFRLVQRKISLRVSEFTSSSYSTARTENYTSNSIPIVFALLISIDINSSVRFRSMNCSKREKSSSKQKNLSFCFFLFFPRKTRHRNSLPCSFGVVIFFLFEEKRRTRVIKQFSEPTANNGRLHEIEHNRLSVSRRYVQGHPFILHRCHVRRKLNLAVIIELYAPVNIIPGTGFLACVCRNLATKNSALRVFPKTSNKKETDARPTT